MVHPYRRPVIGWMEDILNLTRQDLVDHYKLYYEPNNAFIVMAGDFSTAEMLPKIKAAFEAYRADPNPEGASRRTAPARRTQVTLKKEAELPFVLMYYHTPNLKSPDSYALDVLSVVLAGGRSSRLYHDLVYQKRLARSVDADYNGLSIDPSVFSVTAQVMPGKEPAEIEREIDSLLDQ